MGNFFKKWFYYLLKRLTEASIFQSRMNSKKWSDSRQITTGSCNSIIFKSTMTDRMVLFEGHLNNSKQINISLQKKPKISYEKYLLLLFASFFRIYANKNVIKMYKNVCILHLYPLFL